MTRELYKHYPNLLGFEQLLNAMEHNVGQSYPPYNTIKLSDDAYRIEVAAAGFTQEELSVTVEKSQLFIEGKKEKKNCVYIHKGISTKDFKLVFNLGEYVEVDDVFIENGMLVVSLVKNIPEEAKPKSFEIRA